MKNRYNVIVKVQDSYTEKYEFLKYRGVSNFRKLIEYLERKNKRFVYLNYYDEKTKEQKGSYTNKTPP